MKKDRNLEAFMKFYSESYARLEKKTAIANRALKKEPNPILRPFMEDLADLNEGGKMLRGMLVGLGYRIARHARGDNAFDITKSDALAQTFEMFQTGVLVHDDVIDNAAQEDTIKGFNMILDGEVDYLPEQAFLNVGTIEEAIKKGEAILAAAK